MANVNYGRSTLIIWGGSITLKLVDISGCTATTDVIEELQYGKDRKSYYPGYADDGGITLTMSTEDPNDVAYMHSAYQTQAISTLTISAPSGVRYAYNAFITSLTHNFDKTGLYTLTATFKFAGDAEYKPTMISEIDIYPAPDEIQLWRGGTYGFAIRQAGSTAATPGGVVVWTVTSSIGGPRIAAGTKFVGSTLQIDPTQEAGNILITAKMYGAGIATGAEKQENYAVIIPQPLYVSITGEDAPSKVETNTDIGNYELLTLPLAADNAVTWSIPINPNDRYSFVNERNNPSTLQCQNGLTIDTDNGKVIKIRATASNGMIAEKIVTLTVTRA